MFARQVGRQGFVGIALQTICAILLAEVCKRSDDPLGDFERLAASITSAVLSMSENAARAEQEGGVARRALEETVGSVLETAENALIRDLDLATGWRRERSGGRSTTVTPPRPRIRSSKGSRP